MNHLGPSRFPLNKCLHAKSDEGVWSLYEPDVGSSISALVARWLVRTYVLSSQLEIIKRNLSAVRERIDSAASAAGRKPESVRLISVCKYVDEQTTLDAIAAGCTMVGENRPQQIWSKHAAWQQSLATANPPVEAMDVEWHMIGHFQRNKVKKTLPLVDLIHSVDSLRLAEAIAAEAARLSVRKAILIELNVTQDRSKTGLVPEELGTVADFCCQQPSLELCGLMGMARLDGRDAEVERDFEMIREHSERLQSRIGTAATLKELSMGMSGDFEAAIRQGATMIRIGSSLFEGLLSR